MVEGRPLTAREASELGLVHRICPAAELLDDALRTGERLSRRSPHAVAALKRAVYLNDSRSLSAAMDFELASFISTGRNPDKLSIAETFEADLDRLGDSPFVADIQPWLDGSASRGR